MGRGRFRCHLAAAKGHTMRLEMSRCETKEMLPFGTCTHTHTDLVHLPDY